MPFEYQVMLYAKDFGIPHWEVLDNVTADQWNTWIEWNSANQEVKNGRPKN